MDLVDLTPAQRRELQLKRIAYFSSLACNFRSLNDFVNEYDEKLAICGIELTEKEGYVALYMQLDYSEYEQYHIIATPSGHLACSKVIWFQDEYCSNSLCNVETGESADEEDIFKEY